MNPVHDEHSKLFFWLIALVAAVPRVFLILWAPEIVGDGRTYSTVAENIYNGCGVSISPIGSGECVPHFGGNQGPGYPAFIASIWWLSGHSDLAVLLVQGFICILAILYLVHAISCYTSSPRLALLTGLVLALSPLEVAWPRFIFTEALAISGTLLLFAELLRSLHESRLRVFPIAIILVATTFVRLDGILLVVPVAVAGFIIHRPIDALKKGLVISLILGLSWGGWVLRNWNVGLESLFKPIGIEQRSANEGLYDWVSTWSTSPYEYALWLTPASKRKYDAIKIGKYAYYSELEEKQVQALLEELKSYSGKPFPKHIDREFAELTKKRIKDEPLIYYFLVPGKRIWTLWMNVYDSSGWPIGLSGAISNEDRSEMLRSGISGKLLLLKKYPAQIMGKLVVNGWKLLLYILFIIAVALIYKDKNKNNSDLMKLVLPFVIARSVLSGLASQMETRYIVMQIPIIEMMVVLVIGHAYLNRKKRVS